MRLTDFQKMVKDSVMRRLKITAKKSPDYSGQDCLSNFKRVAKILTLWVAPKIIRTGKVEPSDVAFIYQVLKLDRERNLMNKGATPLNESVQDTFDDGDNYSDFKKAAYLEECGCEPAED